MLQVMMALGAYRFTLSTAAYESLARSASWRHPGQDRLGAHPVYQFVGPGEQSMTIEGTMHPHYKGLLGLPNLLSRAPGLAGALGALAGINSALGRVGLSIGGRSGSWQLARLKEDADGGAPMLLVDGRGRSWGYWVVTGLREREKDLFADGAAMSVQFTVELIYYGETATGGLVGDNSLSGLVRGLLGV